MADNQEAICLSQEACGNEAEQAMARLAILQGKKAPVHGGAGFVPPLLTGPAPFILQRPLLLGTPAAATPRLQGTPRPLERHARRPLGLPSLTRQQLGSRLLWCRDSPNRARQASLGVR
jgi:hypothetical protein